jgi:hypothetical protein
MTPDTGLPFHVTPTADAIHLLGQLSKEDSLLHPIVVLVRVISLGIPVLGNVIVHSRGEKRWWVAASS